MGLLPENHAARIAWFQSRIALWNSNATEIGTTTGQVSDVSAKVTAASAALAAQILAQDNAKSATQTLLDAMAELTNSGMVVVEQVRTKSRLVGDGVFPLSNIPAPATPSPLGPPGTPTDFKATLMQGGDVDLGWTCANPAGAVGTTYQIYRRFTPSMAWEFLGASGERKYVDATIPAGITFVMYKIRGIRSTVAGPWGEYNVTFGAGAGEGATVTAVAAPKIAA